MTVSRDGLQYCSTIVLNLCVDVSVSFKQAALLPDSHLLLLYEEEAAQIYRED
jgi:hypothetical protein